MTDENKSREMLEAELRILQELHRRKALEDDELFFANYVKIVDKGGNTVPLELNNVQRKINDTIKELREKGIPPRVIILKSRQMGVSTCEQARMLKKCTVSTNRNGLIVAHREDSTSIIFEKSKFMYNKLPEDIRPLKKASNAKELVFDLPTGYYGNRKGLNSKIKVQTAGSVGIGRGDTNHYVHMSEFAFWEGSEDQTPIKQLNGIMQSVPDTLDSLVVIESTANGFNDFKTLWDDAVNGKNGWTPLFYPWYIHEEYIKPFDSDEQKNRFINEMDEYELNLRNTFNLPYERIHWHRHTKKTKCNNDLNQMKQENPTTAEEAFLMSGTPVFDVEIVANRIHFLREKYKKEPYLEGKMVYTFNDPETKDFIPTESIRFVKSKQENYLRVYEKPKKNTPYVIGGDTKGEGKDFFAATVIDNSTGKRVASLQMQLANSRPFTWQVYSLGVWYNEALIAIEMNFNTAPIEELQRLKYRRQYQRRKYDDYTHSPTPRYGWKTTGTTRPIIIDKTVELVQDDIDLFTDIPTLEEMLTFVYDKNGRPDAMSGKHDDLLISDMIANEVRATFSTTGVEEITMYDIKKLPKDYQEDYKQAVRMGMKEKLMNSWEMAGILDKIKRIGG